jgi:hypothetical protein
VLLDKFSDIFRIKTASKVTISVKSVPVKIPALKSLSEFFG